MPFLAPPTSGGGRTLISSQTPTGVGVVTFSSIPGTYSKLILEAAIRSTQAAAAVNLTTKLNNDTTAANYRVNVNYVHSSGTAGAAAAANAILLALVPGASAPADEFAVLRMEIPQYANGGINHHILGSLSMTYDASAVFVQCAHFSIGYKDKTAITRLDLTLSAGNFETESILKLYGE